MDDDIAVVTFFDSTMWKGEMIFDPDYVSDKPEYSATIEKFDTFIAFCHDPEGTAVELVQYLGTQTINGSDYYVAWHTLAESDSGINCSYPQTAKAGLKHKFVL